MLHIFRSLFGIILLFVLILFALQFGYCQVNNPHEFNINNWNFSERCNPCHVYQSSDDDLRINNIASYPSELLTPSDSAGISEISKNCFSCHDGTVAPFQHTDEFSLITLKNSRMQFGHPVSVQYPVGDYKYLKFHDPEKTLSGLGGTIDSDLLYEGKVECISCHDVHFSREFTACSTCPPVNPEISLGNRSLLKSNKKSSLCLTCHKL